jgi:preprotein translocase subunit SecD
MTLFDRLTCRPGTNARAVSDSWKATVGYTPTRWNAPDSQVVSCDAAGGKYVLGKAVILSTQVTSATPAAQPNTGQWYVDVKLNDAATTAFGTLTTSQYNSHYLRVSQSGGSDENDSVLASTAIVVNGDVQSAPMTAQPITSGMLQIAGPQPGGFTTEAEAAALAAQL